MFTCMFANCKVIHLNLTKTDGIICQAAGQGAND